MVKNHERLGTCAHPQGSLQSFSCVASALAQPGPLGPPFLVNTTKKDRQETPSVASDAAGRFAILWTAVCVPEPDQGPIPLPCTPNPLKSGTFGRWYDTAGRPVGPEIQLSDFVEQFPRPLGVAVGGDGSFFAV